MNEYSVCALNGERKVSNFVGTQLQYNQMRHLCTRARRTFNEIVRTQVL